MDAGLEPGYVVTPSEWVVEYAVQSEPLGKIRRVRSGYRAKFGDEDLGIFDSGDAAVEAIWERFLEANRVRHAAASVTHGGRDRHQPSSVN